jgi:hypothetical protein
MAKQNGEKEQGGTGAMSGSESAVQNLVMVYPAISIRQPWAWLILHGGKDIENRTWPTKFRGKVLLHAAKGMTKGEWDASWSFARAVISEERRQSAKEKIINENLKFGNIERGGIVGIAEIVDSVTSSDSRWFVGPHGFVLRNVEPLPFYPCKGALGFFKPRA